jgi:RHS repeat-associated protein
VAGQALQSFGYADNGNITSKTGTGTYSYDPVRKHAVQSVAGSGGVSHVYAYDDNGRMTTEHARQAGQTDRLIRSITYTSFHQPSLITHHASPRLATDRPLMGGDPSFCQMQFYYGADLQRLMQVRMKGATVTRTLYLGSYELREVYEGLPGPNNLLEREERSSFGNGAQVRLANVGGSFAPSVKLEFSLKDHLGSTSAVHDESGDVQKSRGQQPTDERHSYDAWGARRDSASWAPAGPQLGHSPPPAANSTPPTDPPKVASSQPRGFTGHEMLDDVGLVHMNGRLYDAAIGRFCSADPLIQEGENAQNYNRYTYVLNNPLSHTDPSGFSFWKKFVRALVAIVIAIVVVIAVIYTFGAALSALGAGQFLAGAGIYAGVGSTAAGFTLGIGNAIWMGAALGAAWAGINAVIQGASFSQTLKASVSGAISGAVGAMIGGGLHELGVQASSFGGTGRVIHAVAHGVAGGAMSEANGGSFKDGFIGSLIGAGVTAVAGGVFGKFTNLYKPGTVGYDSIASIAARTAIAAAAGGGASVLAGGKFADGAYSAAFFHLFNNELDNLKKMGRPQVDAESEFVINKIEKWLKSHPGEVYDLNGRELLILMRRDLYSVASTYTLQRMYDGPYPGQYGYFQGSADGTFFDNKLFRESRFSFIDPSSHSGRSVFTGSTINYYFLGMTEAARFPTRSFYDIRENLTTKIVAYNSVWAGIRVWQSGSLSAATHDLRQINDGVFWAGIGHKFYRSMQ